MIPREVEETDYKKKHAAGTSHVPAQCICLRSPLIFSLQNTLWWGVQWNHLLLCFTGEETEAQEVKPMLLC